MLKKEKKRALDAAAQVANITNGQNPVSQNASMSSPKPPSKEGGTDFNSAAQGGRAIQYMNKGTLTFFYFTKQLFYKTFQILIFKIALKKLLKVFKMSIKVTIVCSY